MTKEPLDPLYTIFEQHLYNFEDSEQDRKTFIARVLKEYLGFLRKLKIAIPYSLESLVIDELAIQVNTMLVKKIYGCLSIDDYRQKASHSNKRRAHGRYQRLTKGARSAPPAPPRLLLRKASGT
jgi:hypothetical protein